MKLYHLPYSHFSAKVRVVILEKQLTVDLQDVNALPDPKAFQQINPSSLVPCLVDGTLTLGEAEVIAEYLEDAYPDTPMLPADAELRARSRWLSRVHDLYIAPELTALFGLSQDAQPDQASLNSHVASFQHWLDVVESSVSPDPYCFGEQFCIVDATYSLSLWYGYWLMAQLGLSLDDARYPAIRRWFDAIASRPSFKSVLHDCCAALELDADSIAAELHRKAA